MGKKELEDILRTVHDTNKKLTILLKILIFLVLSAISGGTAGGFKLFGMLSKLI